MSPEKTLRYRVVWEQINTKTRARKVQDEVFFDFDRDRARRYFDAAHPQKPRKGHEIMATFIEYEIKGGFELTGCNYEWDRRYWTIP